MTAAKLQNLKAKYTMKPCFS